MPQFQISQEEWEIAHQYLDNAPDGTKLPFSVELNSVNNQIVPRKQFATNPKPYMTFHSFIKKGGDIFAFQRGSLGEGSENKAKYAMHENGELYVIKVGKAKHPLKNSEIAILSDLKLSKGVLKRLDLDKEKEYVYIQALGMSLKHLFPKEIQPKSLEDRLRIAIQLSWKLYRLHEGHDSLTLTPYAHMDIKPDNITITDDGQLHLIDFGMTEKHPKRYGHPKTEAHRYVAYCDASKNQILTQEQYDVIALKRILHLPASLYGGALKFISRLPKVMKPDVSLFTEQELKQLQLNEYINTFACEHEIPDYTNDKTSAIMLCALLINARHDLKMDKQQIVDDLMLMHAITGFYINRQIEQFSNLCLSATEIKLMAALNGLDLHKQYDVYRQDEQLRKALQGASTFEVARALISLKIKGLETYYEAVLHSQELAETIYVLVRAGAPLEKQHFLTVLSDESKQIGKAILFLKRQFLEEEVKEVINNPALATALSSMPSQECELSVMHMLETKEFTAAEIIQVSTDQRLAKAVRLIKLNEYVNKSAFISIVRSAIATPIHVDACLNMDGMESLNNYEKEKILRDSNKCQAFNFLFALNKEDKKLEISTTFIYSDSSVPAFIHLRTLKMETLCARALQDSYFSYQVLAILQQSFADEITSDMLVDDKTREYLKDIGDYKEKFKGVKILHDMKLLGRLASGILFDFSLVSFLREGNYSSFLPWLMETPSMGSYLRSMLKNESPELHLCNILQLLPSAKRFEFIQKVAEIAILDIKLKLKINKPFSRKIKLLLMDNDKQALSNMIYSDKELTDKQTLKNIKSTIRSTAWSYGFYDPKVNVLRGKMQVSVPSSVTPQIAIFFSVSSGKKAYSEALAEIKKIGREQLKQRGGKVTSLKHFFLNKSETAKYFDLFETDESFERAFVKKS